MAGLPVREMVLYKHGVGFFVRQGEIEGDRIALTFRKDEINDVLKSLAVFDEAGGQILGIHYQTPMDTAARLRSSSIELSQRQSLRDLLRDLRGRDCELTYEATPGTLETIIGRLIGIDEVQTQKDYVAIVSMLTSSGVQIIPYDTLRNIKIADEQSVHDLSYFLDTSMAEDDRRVVTVQMTEGEHRLIVYYVAPSPVWRVSYRLVAQSKDDDSGSGTATLQGWGIFDNRLDEDLEDVRLTLVAGQPISFIYELYASRIPERPIVEDEERIAPGPVEFASASTMMARPQPEAMSDVAFAQSVAQPQALHGRAKAAQPRSAGMDRLLDRVAGGETPAQAETEDHGETFQYIVSTPVTAKRGESALVPIVGKQVKYERELLYNSAKLPSHPVASLRFNNDTGLTLERGPVTLVEDGDYKGEAVIPFTRTEAEVYVPFAVELGIKVTERANRTQVQSGLKIENSTLFIQVYDQHAVTYIIENNTSTNHTVTIEAGVSDAWELFDTRQPSAETAEFQRWQVPVEARQTSEFVVTKRRLRWSHTEWESLTYRDLAQFLQKRWLDQPTYDQLTDILRIIESIEHARNTISDATRERTQIFGEQEQLRANLGALQPTGQEAQLRNRLLKKLEVSQDRLDEISQLISTNQTEVENLESQLKALIDSLN